MDEPMTDATEGWNREEQSETNNMQETHTVTKYRRRDLRNTLASHLGMIKDTRGNLVMKPKQRVRIEGIALDVSDFKLEDMINEFEKPSYLRIYDMKESRVCIFELGDVGKMEQFVEKYNGSELNGNNIKVEIFEQQRGRSRYHASDFAVRKTGNRRGRSAFRGRNRPSRGYLTRKSVTGRNRLKTVEELDAELERYMERGTEEQ